LSAVTYLRPSSTLQKAESKVVGVSMSGTRRDSGTETYLWSRLWRR
jgi:hypothetical protein